MKNKWIDNISSYFVKFVEWHNQLSDKDYVWFPFLFLKPKPSEPITGHRIILMTVCFSLYGVLVLLLRLAWSDQLDWSNALIRAGYIGLGFFVWFHLVTARFWNIRARQLQRQRR